MRALCHVLGLTSVLVGASALNAQDGPHDRRAQWRVGPFLGVAENSPAGTFLGTTAGYDHVFLGIQTSTRILRLPGFHLAYTAQLLPLVRLRGPDERDPRPPGSPARGTRTSYAFGLSPFGLELQTVPLRRVALFGAMGSGGLVFQHEFPVPGAGQINFTLEYGGGVQVKTVRAQQLVIGYKYHHLSNAWYRSSNPGLDGHVIYAGYLWTVLARRE
jgi:lipid A 3-O-deacylase PagL